MLRFLWIWRLPWVFRYLKLIPFKYKSLLKAIHSHKTFQVGFFPPITSFYFNKDIFKTILHIPEGKQIAFFSLTFFRSAAFWRRLLEQYLCLRPFERAFTSSQPQVSKKYGLLQGLQQSWWAGDTFVQPTIGLLQFPNTKCAKWQLPFPLQNNHLHIT